VAGCSTTVVMMMMCVCARERRLTFQPLGARGNCRCTPVCVTVTDGTEELVEKFNDVYFGVKMDSRGFRDGIVTQGSDDGDPFGAAGGCADGKWRVMVTFSEVREPAMYLTLGVNAEAANTALRVALGFSNKPRAVKKMGPVSQKAKNLLKAAGGEGVTASSLPGLLVDVTTR
jgi:hypothetical protein